MGLDHSGNLTYFELLPPEIQCQVLKNVPDTKTLRALLRASPRYFQVYKTSRKIILAHVAWNQITPAILPIALKALMRRDDKKLRRDHSGPFAFQRMPKGPHEISLKTWERLIRFHEIVEYFILGFTISRLIALENSIYPRTQCSLSHISPSGRLNLSQVEYARLARAFYNLELYGNLFYDMNTSRLASFRAKILMSLERASTFLQSLQDWELEELLCVRSYMMESLKDYLNKFEDDFMESFLKNKPYIICPPQDTPGGTSQSDLLSEQGYIWLQHSWIEGCLTRGLETLSTMFMRYTLRGKFSSLGEIVTLGKYMSKALDYLPVFSESELATKMKPPQTWVYDNINQPNEAWFWAMKFRGHSRTYHLNTENSEGRDYHNLECWGYVIWDHERLERLGILTKSPSHIAADIGPDWRIKRSPISLEERARKQEDMWSREANISTLAGPRPVFEWDNAFQSVLALSPISG